MLRRRRRRGGIEDDLGGGADCQDSTFDANKAIATGPNTVPATPGYARLRLRAGRWIDLTFVASGSATISDSTFTEPVLAAARRQCRRGSAILPTLQVPP